jgi:hypothetical protein
MATFTDAMSVSGVGGIETTPSNLSLSPDIRFLSTSETQQTTSVSGVTPTITTYTDTGPLLSSYFQLFECVAVFFGSDQSEAGTDVRPPKNRWHG